MRKLVLSFSVLTTVALFTSCDRDKDNNPAPNPPPVNEQELITTLQLTFIDTAKVSPAPTVVATFKDPDGDGGNPPTVFDKITLKANKVYEMQVLLLDESKTPADTISIEVEEEKNDHQFFYTISEGLNLTHTYLDEDTNTPPLPLGLLNRITTEEPSTGTFKVTLKHQPEIKNNNISTGETDVEVIFDVTVDS